MKKKPTRQVWAEAAAEIESQSETEIAFLRHVQWKLLLDDLHHGSTDEAKQLRSEVIERMAQLAPYIAKRTSAAVHVLALVAVLLMRAQAFAQEMPHHHPTETLTGDVAKFYSTWNRPDNPSISCCNKADCYATQMRSSGGRIQAKRREDGKWLNIPATKIETGRDSPDGRNHLCAPPPEREYVYPDGVICFIAGAGG